MDENEVALARAAAAGDGAAWNELIALVGDGVLGTTMSWCEAGCRVQREDYDCILRTIRAQRPEPAEAPEVCREGLLLYKHTCERLREALKLYDGSVPLGSFVASQLPEIRRDYLEARRGRLSRPAALAEAPALEQDVYALSARVADRHEVARRLGVEEAAVGSAAVSVMNKLEAAGQPWWGLEHPLARPIEAPAWVQRHVAAGGDAPEPQRKGDTWARRAFSQPDWWLGLAIGAVVTAACLLVVIPREDYVKAVRAPSDELLARQDRSLEPAQAQRLDRARQALGQGKIDAALQDLNAVVAVRGDAQEARWLLATTYDRLGDHARAAKHYKLYLDTEQRTRAVEDDRSHKAQERLGRFAEMP